MSSYDSVNFIIEVPEAC